MQHLDVGDLEPNPQRGLLLPHARVQTAQGTAHPHGVQARLHFPPAGNGSVVVRQEQQVQVEADGRSGLCRLNERRRDEREMLVLVCVEQLQ